MDWLVRPWRHAFDFSGRSPRREYWLFVLQYYVLLLAPVLVVAALRKDLAFREPLGPTEIALGGWMILFTLAAFIPGLAVAVRRLHDQGREGMMLLLALIPAVGGFILFFMMLYDGDEDENRYGPNPRDRWQPELSAGVFD